MAEIIKPYKLNPEKLVWGKLGGKYFIYVIPENRFSLEQRIVSNAQLFYWVNESSIDILDDLLEEKPEEKIIKRLARKYKFTFKKATANFQRFVIILKLLLNEE